MKPEFTEVLLSSEGKGKYPVMAEPIAEVQPSVDFRKRALTTSCLLISACTVVVLIGFLGIGFGFICHYDARFAAQEQRLTALESELALFFRQMEIQEHRVMTGSEVNPLSRSRSIVMAIRPEEDVMDDSGSYEEGSDEDVGLPLLSDESDEGSDLEDEDDDEKEAEEIVFGRVNARTSRKKRQLPGNQPGPGTVSNAERSRQSVAIVEGAYGGGAKDLKAATPTESEGLRLYESLITTGGHGEPKAPEFAESDGSNLRSYHRNSAAWVDDNDASNETGRNWSRRRLEVKSGDLSGTSRYGDNPLYGRTSSPYSQHYAAGATASRRTSQRDQDMSAASVEQIQNPNMIVRNSRVPATGDRLYPRNTQYRSTYPNPPLKKIGHGDGEVIARVHQERKDLDDESDPEEAAAGADHGESSAFAVSRSYKGGFAKPGDRDHRRISHRPHRKGQLDPDAEELNIVQAEAWAEGPKTIAAHFVADSSNFSVTHRHYEGNGRLRNADGIFSSWRASDWMSGSEGSKELSLSPTGVVTVKKEGLYWLYAQVHYLDSHDINGFVLQVNTEPFLTCTRMTETAPGTTPKSNSCFTAGINYLKENDRVLIRDIETNRYSIIRPEKSFFGLMRIGDMARR